MKRTWRIFADVLWPTAVVARSVAKPQFKKMAWSEDGWLRTLDGQGIPTLESRVPDFAEHPFPPTPVHEDFEHPELPISFQWLRTPLVPATSASSGAKQLEASSANPLLRVVSNRIAFQLPPSARSTRTLSTTCRPRVLLQCRQIHYLCISHDEILGKHLRVTSSIPDSAITDAFTPHIPIPSGKRVFLRVEIDYERLHFAYRAEGIHEAWLAPAAIRREHLVR